MLRSGLRRAGAISELETATAHLLRAEPAEAAAGSAPYLQLFGTVAGALEDALAGWTGAAWTVSTAIVGALGGSVSTNVPYDQIPGLAHMVMGVPAGRTHLAMLDTANATVTGYSADGENVLLPDPQHIRSLVRGVFPDPQVSRDAAVDVLNLSLIHI